MFGTEEYPYIFQDDNAPPHRGRIVQEWRLPEWGYRIDWPAQYPDLNIIENIWDAIGRDITQQRPDSKQGLIFRSWTNMTAAYLSTLYEYFRGGSRKVWVGGGVCVIKGEAPDRGT